MEKIGGRKFILAAAALLVVLAIMLIQAIRGELEAGTLAILGGIVTAVLTQYGVTNVANKTKVGG